MRIGDGATVVRVGARWCVWALWARPVCRFELGGLRRWTHSVSMVKGMTLRNSPVGITFVLVLWLEAHCRLIRVVSVGGLRVSGKSDVVMVVLVIERVPGR